MNTNEAIITTTHTMSRTKCGIFASPIRTSWVVRVDGYAVARGDVVESTLGAFLRSPLPRV